MGNIVGKQFGVVASKNYTTALAESVKEGNQAKFYLAQSGSGIALDNVTKVTDDDRNTLIINGNKIQGISNNDVAKLNAITDVTKLFKYKGSVSPKDFNALSAYDVNKGDVYNVTGECEVNKIKYPAYTNFVCVNVSQLGPQTSTIEWDSLGGTMQIGTDALRSQKTGSIIHWESKNNIPISSFSLEVDPGLVVDNDGKLSINIGTGLQLYNGASISLQLSTESTDVISLYQGAGVSGLNIDDKGGLHVALATSSDNGTRYLVHLSKGIALDYAQLVTSLKADTQLKAYISSLIDAELKAQ